MPTLRRQDSSDPAAPRVPSGLSEPEGELDELDGAYQLLLQGLDFSGADLTEAEIEQCRFSKANLAGAGGRGTTLVDCVFDQSDLANASFESGGMRRVQVTGSRLTGLTFIDGMVRDAVFRDSKMDLTNWRATTFVNVHFVQCDLTRADFAGADLRGVRFVDCVMQAGQFSGAKLQGARFEGCDLFGIGGIASLAGATIRSDDLLALVALFAAELGIAIERLGDD